LQYFFFAFLLVPLQFFGESSQSGFYGACVAYFQFFLDLSGQLAEVDYAFFQCFKQVWFVP
jgi:hypothetical protein